MKKLKDILKQKHGNKFQDCNFGIKEFKVHTRKLSDDEQKHANKVNKHELKLVSNTGFGEPGDEPGDWMVDESINPDAPGGNQVNKKWACLLLDFTGYYVENTPWNYNGPFTCAPANLTSTQVNEVLENVRGEYSRYKVNVTTDENVFNAAPAQKRMRLVLTETWEWYGQTGGVAFIGSFSWGDKTPCFVFTSLLGNNNTKAIKEAASHELGHTIGLIHQSKYDVNCNLVSEYNAGNGVEAPIMGLPYYAPDAGTKWWVGPTPYGCNDIQDDDQILSQKLGVKPGQ